MNYFAYGSNLSRQQMLERCPQSKPKFPATLHNYKLIFVGWSRQWRGGTASIRRVTAEKVLGAIYEVSGECLRRLDRYEGSDSQRLKVIVNDEDGEPIEAITYIKMRQTEETKPSAEYLAIIRQGYREWRLV